MSDGKIPFTSGPNESRSDSEGEVASSAGLNQLVQLSDSSRNAIRRLREYKAPPDPYGFPTGRAAVMVALFASRDGSSLNVLLTTRSKTMRTYAGNVALPGGKADPEDVDLEATARREAFEEVGLPMDPKKVTYLTTLRPFPSRSMLLVSPVVCLIKDYSIQPSINPSEVDQVFSFPLHAFLQSTPPVSKSIPPSVLNGETPFLSHYDYAWYGGKPHRFHDFHILPVPCTGLTAELLIHVAMVAYGRNPDYQHRAIGQLDPVNLIEQALKDPKWHLRADEGLVAASRLKAKKEQIELEKKKGKL